MVLNKRTSQIVWAAAGAAMIAVIFPALGFAEEPDVVIEGHSERCAADPPELYAIESVCIQNSLDEPIKIAFDDFVRTDSSTGTPTKTLLMKKGQARCIWYHSPASPTDVHFTVNALGKGICTEDDPPEARPRIIIHPPG